MNWLKHPAQRKGISERGAEVGVWVDWEECKLRTFLGIAWPTYRDAGCWDCIRVPARCWETKLPSPGGQRLVKSYHLVGRPVLWWPRRMSFRECPSPPHHWLRESTPPPPENEAPPASPHGGHVLGPPVAPQLLKTGPWKHNVHIFDLWSSFQMQRWDPSWLGLYSYQREPANMCKPNSNR